MRVTLVATFGLLVAACGTAPPAAAPPPSDTVARATVAPVATPATTATPPRVMAFPDVPLVATDTQGELLAYRGGVWNVEASLCGTGTYDPTVALEVASDGRTLLVSCPGPAPDLRSAHSAFLYDVVTKEKRPLPPIAGAVAAMSPDATRVVVGAEGDCPMPAPVCQTRWHLHDLATGTREDLLPSDYWLHVEFRWAANGLTYFRPYCAEAGCAGPEKSGTYSYSMSTHRWMKISADRLVVTNGSDRTVFERRQSLADGAEARVVEVYKGNERLLTPAGVAQEVAVALLADGRTLAWRPDAPGGLSGVMVTYLDGQEERSTRGEFSSYFITSSSGIALAAATPYGANWVIYAYSPSADAFASMPLSFAFERYHALPR